MYEKNFWLKDPLVRKIENQHFHCTLENYINKYAHHLRPEFDMRTHEISFFKFLGTYHINETSIWYIFLNISYYRTVCNHCTMNKDFHVWIKFKLFPNMQIFVDSEHV